MKGGKRVPKGMTFSTEPTQHAYVRVTDMKNHTVNLSDLKYIDENVFAEIRNYTISKNDLYITIAGTIGAVGEFPDELDGMNLTENAVKVTPIVLNKTFLCLMMQTEYVQKQFKNKTYQVAMPKLGLERILTTLIPVCCLTTQEQICEAVNNASIYIDLISENYSGLSDTISVIKSKILDLAIRGKLVPQSPDDEPGSVLLERIRAEKEELIRQGKIKRDKKESVIFKGEDNSYYEKIGNSIIDITDEIPFELPSNCLFVRFKDVWELLSGRDLAPDDYNSQEIGIPYITGASNFTNGSVTISRWTDSPQVVTRLGDLLITCKGTVGETAFNTFGDAHIARQIMAMRNNYDLNIEYLSLCINYYIESLKTAAKGLIPGISREDILNLILPLPSEKYQISVVNRVNELFETIEHIKKSLN